MPAEPGGYHDQDFPVPRMIQSTDTRCGPACCCMILNGRGVAITEDAAAFQIEQQQVEPDDWYADPAAVASCLNAPQDPDPIPFEVAPFVGSSADSALAKLVETVADRHLPCLILVYGGAHWVVADGIRTFVDGTGSSLVGVQIVDPYDSEPPRRFIPARTFVRKYLQPVDFGSRWRGNHVAIGDAASEPPPVSVFQANPSIFFMAHKFRETVLTSHRWDLISEWSLARSSVSGLGKLGFLGARPVRGGGAPFRTTQVIPLTSHQEPYFVTVIDGTDDSALGGLTSVAISATDGEILEISAETKTFQESNERAVSAASLIFKTERYDLDEQVYWAPLRTGISLFSVIRKVTIRGVDHFVSSSGRTFDIPPAATKGG